MRKRINSDLRVYQSAVILFTTIIACLMVLGGLTLKHERKHSFKERFNAVHDRLVRQDNCYMWHDGHKTCPPTWPVSQVERGE